MNGPYHCWDLQYYSIKIVNIFMTIISMSFFNIVLLRTQEISVALHINLCLICTVNPRVCFAENAPTV